MRYSDLTLQFRKLPIFSAKDLVSLGDSERNASNQLIRWTREDKVWRLKRGLYMLPDSVRDCAISLRWLANRLYSPSYVSLDTVLSFYDLIPEYVPVTTSVCVAKTASFQNPLGQFTYHSIQEQRFFGYEEIPDENGVLVRMAAPEKALMDRIYFDQAWKNDISYFEENLRLQNLTSLNMRRLKAFTKKFSSKKITDAYNTPCLLRKQS